MKVLKRVKREAGRMVSTAKKIIKNMRANVSVEQDDNSLNENLFLDNEKIKRLVQLSREESSRMPSNLTRKERHEWAKKMIEKEFGENG